jgi:formylglycine-generating enzyme required for sulfatase activity
LIEQLDDDSLSHERRLFIGNKLTEFGDTRPGVGLRPDGLPDIVWINIPGGRVTLEGIDHVFEIKPFRMAKYLVTNAQFEVFLKSEDGYRNDEWWCGIEKADAVAEQIWQEANSPRDTVSWYEAVAFGRWLSHRAKALIRLPTEWEWQQAATGGDPMRDYPWPGEWDAARCNSKENQLGRTTAVGMYPSGVTSQGVLDMAGNLWEWCLNKYEDLVASESVRIDNSFVQRVIRGGSYYNGPQNLRVSTRHGYSPDFSSVHFGFRLAQDIS